ncbi:MAG: transposase [Verrucomicrobia bacterium]|nr:transposase [Verrucomicrobiota bacterium]
MNKKPIRHKHLRRLAQIHVTQPVYFITASVFKRRDVLANDHAWSILKDEWSNALSRHQWAIGRYVIMPDHVHFFCSAAGSDKPLSAFMKQWKQWTSKRLVRECNLQPPIWQAEFFDHVLRSDESRSEKWLYVRDNPVRAGLVKTAEDWNYQGWIDFP